MLAALALLAGFVPACAEPVHEPSRSLLALERLAFVEFDSTKAPGPGQSLLVGRFEVTRGELRAWLSASGYEVEPALAQFMRRWEERTMDWPASFVTLAEAQQFAASVAMRLPTQAEWLLLATGRARWDFPWGPMGQQGKANTLELKLGRACSVGTFEAGASPSGCYDLFGNVFEWAQAPAGGRDAEFTWALGGSFRSAMRSLSRPEFLIDQHVGHWLHVATRSDDVGFRCVADAAQYLSARAPSFGSDRASLQRLRGVGKSWGKAAVPLLESLCARESASPALLALLEGARS